MLTLTSPPEAAERSWVSEADLETWLSRAQPGDRLTYHQGFLAVDIAEPRDATLPPTSPELRRVARLAATAAERGAVHAVQQRNGANDFTYVLIARRPPRRGHAVTLDRRPTAALSPRGSPNEVIRLDSGPAVFSGAGS